MWAWDIFSPPLRSWKTVHNYEIKKMWENLPIWQITDQLKILKHSFFKIWYPDMVISWSFLGLPLITSESKLKIQDQYIVYSTNSWYTKSHEKDEKSCNILKPFTKVFFMDLAMNKKSFCKILDFSIRNEASRFFMNFCAISLRNLRIRKWYIPSNINNLL